MYNKIMGIYKIENLTNGKEYIGSSNDIPKRWKQHLGMLNKNNHHSIHLQRAWNKYGESNFKFEVLELVHEESLLFEVEQKWMDKIQSYDPSFGYNMSKTADCPTPPLYSSSKVHLAPIRGINLLSDIKLSIASKGFYYIIREFVNDQNILYYKNVILNQNSLCKLLDVDRKTVYRNLRILNEANLIKLVQEGKEKHIYINPKFYMGSRNIEKEIYDIFNDNHKEDKIVS